MQREKKIPDDGFLTNVSERESYVVLEQTEQREDVEFVKQIFF